MSILKTLTVLYLEKGPHLTVTGDERIDSHVFSVMGSGASPEPSVRSLYWKVFSIEQ